LLIGWIKCPQLYHDRATCIIWWWCRSQLFEPNYEGLGLQDEYGDGIGRDFLIDAGGSLNPAIIWTVRDTSTVLCKMVKLF
jgi:3-oxoacyl-[acyl-carrier-protein] synthase-3